MKCCSTPNEQDAANLLNRRGNIDASDNGHNVTADLHESTFGGGGDRALERDLNHHELTPIFCISASTIVCCDDA